NIGPGTLGELRIDTTNGSSNATALLGIDDSRQANKLRYDTTFIKFAGTYSVDDHVVHAGIEREQYDIFNMFVQNSRGTYFFSSIDDFEQGLAREVRYN